MKKPMKKAQGGIKLKPGQVTAKRAYAISDSLKKESEKPLDMTSEKSLGQSGLQRQRDRQKSQRINQRADNAMEKAGGERRFAKNDMMLKYKSGGKMEMGGSLKTPTADQKGLKKLPTPVRNKMGFKKNGGVMSKKK
tara:strand:- start:319 stop:729 length:411 start_codon:yes stop_codon:yes gene_type:complete